MCLFRVATGPYACERALAARAMATISSTPLCPCCQQVLLMDLQHGGIQPFPLNDTIVRQYYGIYHTKAVHH